MPRSDNYALKPISSWNEFLSWTNKYGRTDPRRIVFRGESSDYGNMRTGLERHALSFGIGLDDLPSIEERMKNEFERRIKNYLPYISEKLETVECLALMQHFGAPTRLLDWTYSPFIAVFFAVDQVNNCNDKQTTAVLWALDATNYEFNKVKTKYRMRLSGSSKRIKDEQSRVVDALLKDPILEVVLVNPFYLNERLTIQQGTFLMPGDVSRSFDENLCADKKLNEKLTKVEIKVESETRKEFLFNLHKMNINRATLFPGLEGFAESLRTRLAFPEFLSE